jgi:hypothetical protein
MKSNNNPALPEKLAKPAQRALAGAGINTLRDLERFTEDEIKGLHGIGKNALSSLKQAMQENSVSFSVKGKK